MFILCLCTAASCPPKCGNIGIGASRCGRSSPFSFTRPLSVTIPRWIALSLCSFVDQPRRLPFFAFSSSVSGSTSGGLGTKIGASAPSGAPGRGTLSHLGPPGDDISSLLSSSYEHPSFSSISPFTV